VLGQSAQRRDFAHVFSNVKVRFACNWAASGAGSTLDAFKKLVLLDEFLSIHVGRHFYVKRKRKVIKAFSRESSEPRRSQGDFTDGKEIA
jgi:hypothetical protein